MQIGRKIYYEKNNGVIIWDKGQMEGDVVETTLEQDKEVMPVLTLIDPGQLGVKQLAYDELENQFENCRGYRINPTTKEVEFVTQ